MPASPVELLRPFTPAQERVAELLADGRSEDAIARTLGCSYHTVRAHVRAMARALAGDGPPGARVRAFVRARRAAA